MSSLITGTFILPSGAILQSGNLTFKPLSTPFIFGAAVVITQSMTATTDTNGQFAINLAPGSYKVIVNNGSDAFNIQVPDDGNPYDLLSIISTTLAATGPASSPQVYTVDKLATVLTDTESVRWTRNADYDAPPTSFVFLGNYGNQSDTSNLAAAMSVISTLNPAAIFGLGNNNDADTPRATHSYDNIIGQFFHSYLSPYTGTYGGAAASGNIFWPALGFLDSGGIVGTGFSYTDYLTFFSGQISFGQRSGEYYTITRGDVQFFVLNSDKNATDGFTATSVQGVWLQTQLAASTARWKIVCFFASPYSSQLGYNDTWMRWPFDVWGANAVISSDCSVYERFQLNGVTYFTVGLLSDVSGTLGSIQPNSQFQDNTHPGILSLSASDYALDFEYIDTTGVIRDSFQIVSAPTAGSIYAAVKLSPVGGLIVTPSGIGMKSPNIAIGQNPSPNPYVLTTSQIVISATPPDVVANPLFANCLWLLPGARPTLYLWNVNLVQWITLIGSDATSPLLAMAQLPALTFTPGTGMSRASGIAIGNISGGATVYFSIDGGTFTALTSGTTIFFPFVTLGYLGVYQVLSGNIPSPITSGIFTP